MTEIQNRNIAQLKNYAKWEKENFPDDKERMHILDWAVAEIEQLRAELNQPDMLFQSAVSGMWYRNKRAAGDVIAIKIGSKIFKAI